jgi:hypothetical protein
LRTANRNVLYAQQQVEAAQDSVKAIQKQMRMDQRPWVKIAPSTDKPMRVDIGVNHPLKVFMALSNIGKTPARNIVARIVVRPINDDLPGLTDDFTGSTEIAHFVLRGGTMFPNDKITDVPVIRGRKASNGEGIEADPITFTEHDDLMHGKSIVAIYGKVMYDDVFNIHHWTYFCYEANPSDNYVIHPGGSAVETQCMRYSRVDKN